MKDIVHGSLLVESIFEITYEKVTKSVYENPIFWGVCGNPHTTGTLGLRMATLHRLPILQGITLKVLKLYNKWENSITYLVVSDSRLMQLDEQAETCP